MAEFMRRCKGKVMVSINDHPDIREAFAGFQIEQTSLKYSVANQRQEGQAASSELVIMNWQPEVMVGCSSVGLADRAMQPSKTLPCLR